MKRVLSLTAAALMLTPACASAETWSLFHDSQRGGMVLAAMPDQDESDTDLWLLCRKDGRFDVGAGANDDTGKGQGDKVSVTYSSAGKTAVLHGVSKESLNAPMTGGTELVTTITRDDPLFTVLSTNKPLKMNGKTLGTRGLQKNLTKFLADCPAKK